METNQPRQTRRRSRDLRVGKGELTDEGSPTIGPHVGGDITLAKDRREIRFGDIVNLLNARSAKVDAIKGAGIAANDGGNSLNKLADGQGTSNGLDAGKGLSDAELVVIRSTADKIKHSAVPQATGTYSARQTAFLTVG